MCQGYAAGNSTDRASKRGQGQAIQFATSFGETKLRLVQENDNPLKEESKYISFSPAQVTRVVIYIGCCMVAFRILLIIGVEAFLVVQARVTIGPAPLTSWMRQHVYLTLNGYTLRLGREDLLPGQAAASDEFARLMLSAHVTHPSDWRRVHSEVGDSGPAKVAFRRDAENED